ncbi:MAG: glycosyltransferase family 4 protein [Magnetococcales bacterium]|nr:glycosyltransferase family 4 protein [Magnetococcales bacterium]
MNILVVTREIPPIGGGAGSVAWALARGQAANGHAVHVVTMQYGQLPRGETCSGVHIHRVPCGRRQADSSYLMEMSRFVWNARPVVAELMKRVTFDVIHAHAIIPDGLIALRAGRSAGLPTVVTSHGSDVPGYNPNNFRLAHRLLRPVWQGAVAHFQALVTPSHYLKGLILRRRPGAAVRVLPYGIETDIFGRQPREEAFLISSRLIERKKFQVFFQALAGISRPQTLHVIGEGPMGPELRRLAGLMPWHSIRFHGWVANRSALWTSLYERCRYFVFPSERENFPVSLMEAQLAGMVVLASDIAGNREVLGEEALYFPHLSAKGIRATLTALVEGPPDGILAVGERGRQRILDNFAQEKITLRYEALFREVAGRG